MPRYAANLTMMFNEVAFPQRFAAAAQAGFTDVEFLFPYEYPPVEVAKWLRDSGLTNVLFNLPPGDWAAGDRGLACLPQRQEEFRAGVAKALEYAAELGTPRLHVMAGIVPQGGDKTTGAYHATYVENVRYAAQEVAKHGKTLLIEPINPRDMPGYFLNTQAQAHAVRQEVGLPNLQVQMDFYHVQIVEGDIAVKLQKYFPHVGHIQIAGVPERHEPDEGEVNYRYLMHLLDKLGYQGYVGCEYRPRGGTVAGLGWIKAMT